MRRFVLVLFLLVACKRSEDEAARERIFSPEQPVGAAAEAREPLDARKLDSDPKVAQRVLHMTQAEIGDRLGPHKSQQRVQFAWFRGPGLPDGGSEVSLSEETTLLDGASGDFSVRQVNDHNQGLELVWKGGEVYVKSLYGPFHKRRTDRTDVNRIREQALSGLSTFDRLARGLKLKAAGETTAEGRRVLKYQVAGWGARAGEKEKSDLPPVVYPDGKPDPDTSRRLELWQEEQPTQVSGTILVDAETGVPVGCDLEGQFKVAASAKSQPAAELSVHSVLVTSSIGRDPGIKTPQAEPEPSVPHAVKDPLRFLGKEPGAVAGTPSTEEPDETDSDEEEAPEPPPAKPAPKPK
jgi:hypothetical protein